MRAMIDIPCHDGTVCALDPAVIVGYRDVPVKVRTEDGEEQTVLGTMILHLGGGPPLVVADPRPYVKAQVEGLSAQIARHAAVPQLWVPGRA